MKKKQTFYLLSSLVLLLIFLMISCKKKKAVWYTDWSSPLINDTLTLNHLANDSTLSEVGSFYELNLDRKLIDLDLAELIEIRDTIISEEFNTNITINLSPGFSFVNSIEEYSLDIEDVQLKTVVLKNAYLDVKVVNPLSTVTIFNITLPGITKNGVTFSNQYFAPSGTNLNPGIVDETINLSGYQIDLTGISGGEFNKLQSQITVSTDPIGPSVSMSPNQITKADVAFRDIKIDYARGYFGNKSFSDTILFDVPVLNNILSGLVDLPNTSIGFEIENGIKVSAEGTLTNISNENASGNTVNLLNDQIGTSFNINPATGNWNTINPSLKTILFNSSNSNIESYLENLGFKHELGYNFRLNPWGNVTGGWDELFPNSKISVSLNADMPLMIGVDQLILRDTFDINFNQDGNIFIVNSGELLVETSNSFPYSAAIKLFFLDESGNILHQVNGTSEIESAQFGSFDLQAGLMVSDSELRFILGQAILNDINLIKYLIVEPEFNTLNPSTNIVEPMGIPLGAFFAIKVKTKLTTENTL